MSRTVSYIHYIMSAGISHKGQVYTGSRYLLKETYKNWSSQRPILFPR